MHTPVQTQTESMQTPDLEVNLVMVDMCYQVLKMDRCGMQLSLD